MSGTLYLVWRYLTYHRLKSVILVGSLGLMVYLPLGLNVLVVQSADELTARAEATPLLVGAKGSPLELVLNSLYFESEPPPSSDFAEVQRIADSGLAEAIPLHVRFRAQRLPDRWNDPRVLRLSTSRYRSWTADGAPRRVRTGGRATRAPGGRSRRLDRLLAGERLRSGRSLSTQAERGRGAPALAQPG